jgi:Flp pilus assembly protein TadG
MNIKDQKGAAIVEFALILPLLLILLFGIIEISLLLYNKAMITNASREGARTGIVFDFDDNGTPGDTTDDTYHPTVPEIRQVVRIYAENHLVTFGSDTLVDDHIEICVNGVCPGNPATASSGDELTVTANYKYDFLVFPRLVSLANFLDLKAVTKMRFE